MFLCYFHDKKEGSRYNSPKFLGSTHDLLGILWPLHILSHSTRHGRVPDVIFSDSHPRRSPAQILTLVEGYHMDLEVDLEAQAHGAADHHSQGR